ncbi:MAG: hypothetical protein MJA30_13150, partial [Cytophagales bacterium]|nr:hypothetical protein [Cytophagales bacterium]
AVLRRPVQVKLRLVNGGEKVLVAHGEGLQLAQAVFDRGGLVVHQLYVLLAHDLHKHGAPGPS